jgi:hypothetical protein
LHLGRLAWILQKYSNNKSALRASAFHKYQRFLHRCRSEHGKATVSFCKKYLICKHHGQLVNTALPVCAKRARHATLPPEQVDTVVCIHCWLSVEAEGPVLSQRLALLAQARLCDATRLKVMQSMQQCSCAQSAQLSRLSNRHIC